MNCADDGINCEERQRLEAEIERLHAENAELLAAISRIETNWKLTRRECADLARDTLVRIRSEYT